MKTAIEILKETAKQEGYIDEVDMVCVSGDIDSVIDAMEAYASQFKPRPYSLDPKAENHKVPKVGESCKQNFGEGILRNCTVVEVTDTTFSVVADYLGWKMSNIPFEKFNKH